VFSDTAATYATSFSSSAAAATHSSQAPTTSTAASFESRRRDDNTDEPAEAEQLADDRSASPAWLRALVNTTTSNGAIVDHLQQRHRRTLPLCSLQHTCATNNGTYPNWPCRSSLEMLPGVMRDVRPRRRPSTTAAPYSFASCPLLLRNYACTEDDAARAASLHQRRFEPHFCRLAPFDAAAFLERMSGARLIFIGDSLNRQFFLSLVCSLVAHTTATAGGGKYSYELFDAADDFDATAARWGDGDAEHFAAGSQRCDVWYKGRCPHYLRTHVHFVARNVTVSFAYTKKWNAAQWRRLVAGIGFGGDDTIVYSVGVFYRGNLAAHKQDMHALLSWLVTTAFAGRFLFREMAATHFAGDAQGLYRGDDGGGGDDSGGGGGGNNESKIGSCALFDASKGYQYHWKDLLYLLSACRWGLLPLVDMDGASTSSVSSSAGSVATMSSKFGDCARVHALPVYDIVQTQHDAHFGEFGSKPDARESTRDCVHFCQPSAAVDTWTRVLYNLLINEQRETAGE
jgi:hypothetical protein